MPDVAEQPTATQDDSQGDMDFGLDEQGKFKDAPPQPKPEDAPPRDDKGRFTKAADEPPVEEAPAPETKPEEPPAEAPAAEVDTEGLTLDSDKPPVFGHDGKFIGGKFDNKYETIDEALIAFKNAQREVNRLQYELRQSKANPQAPNPELSYVFDPHDMTPERMAEQIAKDIAGGKKMTLEEQIEYEENPSSFIAKKTVAAMAAFNKRAATTRAWTDATRHAYTSERTVDGRKVPGMDAKLYDRAYTRGDDIVGDWKLGKLGPAELRVLIGMGELARDGLLSGEKEVTRIKPSGRDPVTSAQTHVPQPVVRKTQEQEDDEYLAECQRAAYGT